MESTATLLMTDIETAPIIDFGKRLICNINVINAVVLEGWGIKSIYNINNREVPINTNIKYLQDKFEVGILIICKPYRYFNKVKEILTFLENNKNTITKVYCDWNEIKNEVKIFCIKNELNFEGIGYDDVCIKNLNNKLYQIRTPVIFVSSLSEFTDKFFVEMKLYDYYVSLGYHSVLVGSKSYSTLLGIKSFPQFLFSKELSNFDKIIKFNHYISNIEKIEQPDLIIVGIPGGIDDFINGISNYVDDIIYLVSKAIKPDITIINVLYNEIGRCSVLTDMVNYKYGWNMDGIFISNKLLDLQLSNAYGKQEYIKVHNKLLNEDINKDLNFENKFFSYNSIFELCKMTEEKLVNFGEVMIV